MTKIRPIAIHLPQFHPTPENNEWWGKGFTEWTNVTKAKPLFKGHNQPQLPVDLGFYDLRHLQTHIDQANLAKEYGIEGFAYYHYWFHGKRLLSEPIDLILKHKEINFPFCLFWANETWSRRWLGEEREILLEQTYSFDDDKKHIKWLIEAFKDPRYIKVDNRPVLIIYRASYFPDISKTLEIFKNECIDAGVPQPYFIASNSHAGDFDLRSKGFDSILDFQPQLGKLENAFTDKKTFNKLLKNIKLGVFSSKLKIYEYLEAKKKMITKHPYPYFPCSFVGWDNTARRGKNGIIIKNSSPEIYKKFLDNDFKTLLSMNFSEEENFVFINAWNEWAEGNHLEPDMKFGTQFLEATKEIINKYNS